MFNFFSRKEKISPPPPLRSSSLFSTEVELKSPDFAQYVPDVLRRSFQRSVGDFKAVTADGKPATATDAKTSAKTDSISTFAMDSPSIGNATGMKPLIEPFNTVPMMQLLWYAAQGFIGYQVCAMIAQHWLVDKACTMPARDAMRHGYELATTDGVEIDQKVMDYIKKRDKEMRVKENCVELVRFNRIFGIRIAMFIIDTKDPEFYQNPFNPDGVTPGSYKGISQVDPYWITPELDYEAGANPASIHFYEPTWWRINGKRIHRTHLIVIRNGQVADVLKPSYLYGGVSIPQKIAERVFAAERTANEAPMLAMTKRTTIWKMDIAQAVANQSVFEAKMSWFANARDNFGVKAIGLDDEAEQFDTALSDFDQTIMTQYALVAAIAEVPSTKLLGTSPKGGLGANGDYEEDSYHEFLETLQSNDMQPLIERHHLLLMKSEVEPKLGSRFEAVIVWNPVDTPSAAEQATINLTKAQTGNMLVTSGAIDGSDERSRIISDKNSGYNGIADIVPGGPGDDPDYIPVTNRKLSIKEGGEEDEPTKPVS